MSNTLIPRAFLIVAILTLACVGCRTPKLGDEYGQAVPKPPVRGGEEMMPPDGTFEVPGLSEWEPTPLTEPLPAATEDAGMAAGTERRWEGVAVYFAYDRSTIGSGERAKVEALADYMQDKPNTYVVVEGHCDERGSDEYNRALGERRALAVRDYLESLGISPDRIQTVSYGEERPAVPDATTEAQHAKNRRAEFLIGTTR